MFLFWHFPNRRFPSGCISTWQSWHKAALLGQLAGWYTEIMGSWNSRVWPPQLGEADDQCVTAGSTAYPDNCAGHTRNTAAKLGCPCLWWQGRGRGWHMLPADRPSFSVPGACLHTHTHTHTHNITVPANTPGFIDPKSPFLRMSCQARDWGKEGVDRGAGGWAEGVGQRTGTAVYSLRLHTSSVWRTCPGFPAQVLSQSIPTMSQYRPYNNNAWN